MSRFWLDFPDLDIDKLRYFNQVTGDKVIALKRQISVSVKSYLP